MSFDTLTNLSAEILSGLWKTSADTALVAAIPGHIALVETELNLRLRVRHMVTRTTTTVNAEYINAPADFAGPRSFRLTAQSPVVALEYMGEAQLNEFKNTWDQQAATPSRYTVVGTEFEFSPVPTGSDAASLTYYARIPALTGAANWVLTYYPHLYYHGALSYGWRFLRDDAQSDREWSIFLNMIEEANDAQKRESTGGLLHIGQPLPAGI